MTLSGIDCRCEREEMPKAGNKCLERKQGSIDSWVIKKPRSTISSSSDAVVEPEEEESAQFGISIP